MRASGYGEGMRLRVARDPGRCAAWRLGRRPPRAARRRRFRARARARSSRPRTSGTGRSTDLPVAADSDAMIRAIGVDEAVHPDFGSVPRLRHPVQRRRGQEHQEGARCTFDYADESDRAGYPIPAHAHEEGGGDAARPARRQATPAASTSCTPRERQRRQLERRLGRDLEPALEPPAPRRLDVAPTPRACRSCPASCATTRSPPARSGTRCGSRAETHAERATSTRRATTPATRDATLPPMGLRVRLKASSTSRATAKQARVVLRALKTYGMILADNGSALVHLRRAATAAATTTTCTTSASITGSDFEVVDTSGMRNG